MKGLKDKTTGRFSKNIPVAKNCVECLQSFSPRHEVQKFCSRICMGKASSKITQFENGSNWKGDKVGYPGLHKYLKRVFGKPFCCELCGISNQEKSQGYFHWANLDGNYNRIYSEWGKLCQKCHNRLDRGIINRNLVDIPTYVLTQ